MSEKPQETRADEQGDLLEQIIARELDKIKVPTRVADGSKAPPGETSAASVPGDSGESAATADRKHRRSAVYLYLLILFGAAFLMLLLAYFVQRRSSEDTISDLRDSMNLSRAELLAEVRELEEQNTALEGENNALNEELNHLKADWDAYQEQVQEEIKLWDQDYAVALEYLYAWNSFWELERYYQAGDYESCAAVLILQAQGQYSYRAPDAARQEEIVQAVIDAGILDREYYLHPEQCEDLLEAYFAEQPITPIQPRDWEHIIYN